MAASATKGISSQDRLTANLPWALFPSSKANSLSPSHPAVDAFGESSRAAEIRLPLSKARATFAMVRNGVVGSSVVVTSRL